MLSELCKYLNNWFDDSRHFGTFVIADGSLTAFDGLLQNGQYFRIEGSVFNDGVYKYPNDVLQDETFDGAVWVLKIPQAVIALSEEIDAWNTKYGGASSEAMSPFLSESFGGYSYSKGSGASGSGAGGASWQDAFASRLSIWRKPRCRY
ncbi:MAG: hypothetical protein IJI19_06090 [Ruminococcus sp.]|nr:hypothetical protein [Ruminococcus sp.]